MYYLVLCAFQISLDHTKIPLLRFEVFIALESHVNGKGHDLHGCGSTENVKIGSLPEPWWFGATRVEKER